MNLVTIDTASNNMSLYIGPNNASSVIIGNTQGNVNIQGNVSIKNVSITNMSFSTITSGTTIIRSDGINTYNASFNNVSTISLIVNNLDTPTTNNILSIGNVNARTINIGKDATQVNISGSMNVSNASFVNVSAINVSINKLSVNNPIRIEYSTTPASGQLGYTINSTIKTYAITNGNIITISTINIDPGVWILNGSYISGYTNQNSYSSICFNTTVSMVTGSSSFVCVPVFYSSTNALSISTVYTVSSSTTILLLAQLGFDTTLTSVSMSATRIA